MRKMTEQNLNSAYAGESMAHVRYLIYADRAERDGKPNIARLFRAISYAEQVHATNHYRALGNIKSTRDNLDVAIDGETYEIEEMYPAYLNVADLQQEKDAHRSFTYAIEAEKIHAQMYQQAREASLEGQDITLETVHICSVCGHTVEGEVPDFCPICGSRREFYKAF